MYRKFAGLMVLLAGALVGACGEDATEPSPQRTVAVRFGTAATSAGGVSAAVVPAFGSAALDEVLVTGTNGTLSITDIRFIVEEFELKRADVDCDTAANEDACEKIEAPPSFVDLPLGPGAVTAASAQVETGSFEEIEFEVDDVEVDADDSAEEQAQTQALLATIRQTFPDWPGKASMIVIGSFTPTGGTARNFRVYFRAEIEIEREFEPPLVIDQTNRNLTIEVVPENWFKQPDGTVLDLSQFDFATTAQLVEFELEMDEGFEQKIDVD
ncbi:MAG: hypothetical protein HY561_02430 [Gemmatimonadetes bacterium]|nr:hypothetical protein [Gemmatimonadota bacterium]